MENNEIQEQLVKIATSLEGIADSLEKEAEVQAVDNKPTKDFGFGKIGSTPSSGADPLTSFLLS